MYKYLSLFYKNNFTQVVNIVSNQAINSSFVFINK